MSGIYSSPEGARAVEHRYRELLGRWPVPSEHVRVPTGQGETFVLVSGPQGAPAVVLLHGSGANSAMWMGDVAAWARRFRVYAVDVIGEPGLSAPSRPSLGSDAYAGWLDDVLDGLGVQRAAMVGVSLGGWLAVDYATRRTRRAERLALLCPSGIGRQRWLPLLGALPLMALGDRGRRRAMRRILGPAADDVGGDLGAFALLINKSFRPRRGTMPVFGDEALRGLAIPVLAIVGGRDALLDSRDTCHRLERHVPHADVRLLPDAGHLLPACTREIMGFLETAHA
ncbi:alpha/beta fold hydrolase [Nonomuraea sp. K274]|uniref:Alpha/beta fold hydrolase n=1 Tax=Nonomuraea cypriaca TaxID=1187855 RepID=A0A931EYN3_9ACTN|nr:alpha/beta fold hydrolase [Nonomuraea cypriaca]MBF8185391.1 alpha/beta fold hydrolase [Nonomuraea cypriaca]